MLEIAQEMDGIEELLDQTEMSRVERILNQTDEVKALRRAARQEYLRNRIPKKLEILRDGPEGDKQYRINGVKKMTPQELSQHIENKKKQLYLKYDTDPTHWTARSGCETVIDKSKAIKTFLKQAFEFYFLPPRSSCNCHAKGPDAPIAVKANVARGQLYDKVEGKQFSMDDAGSFVFYSPYNKLVQEFS
ncbi:hypothetical protein POM88_052724 [Heracleum sosnowskyi]|uniref:Uncharacterized protein n=1 Tax=Heracleum sosnowskyi TaxID=360622 RepID=A0AAD8GRT2_9APIA|nr:hypothetical protein POM88_052724 [Heracleum sosnowskyi]